jgi:hypothetical protein
MTERTPVSSSTPARRRTPVVVLSAGVAVATVFGVSSCGQAGVAGKAGGRSVSVTDVQKATKSLKAADPTSFATVTDAQVVSLLLIAPYAERAASAAGQGVSDDTVREELLENAQQNGAKNVDPGKLDAGALELLRGYFSLSSLATAQQQAVVDQFRAAHVKIAPRYGTFDAATGSISAPAPNWIKPTPKPSATASASPSASG